MSKVVLIDFDERDRERLLAEGFETELLAPKPGDPGLPAVPPDLETLFFQMGLPGEGGRARNGLAADLAPLVEAGARVVCFVGLGDLVDLTAVVGAMPGMNFQEADPAEDLTLTPKAPFNLIFERFRPSITHAYKLSEEPVPDPGWDAGGSSGSGTEFLAKGRDGRPVSALIHRGRGFYLLLPSFGPKNVEVAGFFLKNVAPMLELQSPGTADYGWLDKAEYTFPALTDLLARRTDEIRRHEEALRGIDDELKKARASEQEAFNRLLRSDGAELREAVIQALKYLGWGRVVDVNEYWKKVIRSKEEDAWLIGSAELPVEASLQREPLILVLVRSGRNWATDDECALLQKYKGRRMQEFDNTKMKAVLVGNYFLAQEASARMSPFSPLQIEEAQKDGNGLLTTYDLFRAVKAEKEGRARKEAIRGQLAEKTGLVKLEW